MNKKNGPEKKVSVIIPTINRHGMLNDAILSVINQNYKNIEIVVVDDFSKNPVLLENFPELIKSQDILIVRNEKQMGGAASRNIGVKNSNGDFICFLDDDDIYYPEKIDKLMSAINLNHVDAAFGKVKLFDGNRFIKVFNDISRFDIVDNIVLMNMIHNNATLIKRNVLDNVKFLESLKRYQDMQFNVELSLKCRMVFVDEHVAEWRVDDRSDKTTFDGGKDKLVKDLNSLFQVIEYFSKSLNISSNNLILYKIKAIKMHFSLGNYLDAFKLAISSVFSSNPFILVRSLMLRKKYWSNISNE